MIFILAMRRLNRVGFAHLHYFTNENRGPWMLILYYYYHVLHRTRISLQINKIRRQNWSELVLLLSPFLYGQTVVHGPYELPFTIHRAIYFANWCQIYTKTTEEKLWSYTENVISIKCVLKLSLLQRAQNIKKNRNEWGRDGIEFRLLLRSFLPSSFLIRSSRFSSVHRVLLRLRCVCVCVCSSVLKIYYYISSIRSHCRLRPIFFDINS